MLLLAPRSALRGWQAATRAQEPAGPYDAPRLADGVVACALLSCGYDARQGGCMPLTLLQMAASHVRVAVVEGRRLALR